MEAGDPGAGGVARDGEGQASAGGPGGQGGPGGRGGPRRGGSGEAGAVPGEAPQAAPAPGAPVGGSDGEAEPAARAPRPEPFQFVLMVPFRSTMEALFAYHILAPRARPQPEPVHQEVTVSSSVVTIRLTAEDMDRLRLSISDCLQELFLLIQNMWHTMPQFYFINPKTLNGS